MLIKPAAYVIMFISLLQDKLPIKTCIGRIYITHIAWVCIVFSSTFENNSRWSEIQENGSSYKTQLRSVTSYDVKGYVAQTIARHP